MDETNASLVYWVWRGGSTFSGPNATFYSIKGKKKGKGEREEEKFISPFPNYASSIFLLFFNVPSAVTGAPPSEAG